MKLIIFLFSIAITIIPLTQTEDKTYVTQGYSNDDNGYNICEIVVHLDSSYTFKTYKVAKRKDRKDYRTTTPIISFGKIKREGDYYIHTEYKDGNPTDDDLVSRLSDKKIILYKEHNDGYLERLKTYKQIDYIQN